MRYQDIITIEPGKRGGKPCIRGMRITVYDIFSYLAAGSIRGLRPLRYEKRIARNRFVMMSLFFLVVLWWLISLYWRHR